MTTRHLFCAVLVTICAIAEVGLVKGTEADAPAQLPANLWPTFPRKGVDHVVSYASWRGWGPKDGDRVVVFRHNGIIRTETYFIGSKRPGEDEHTTAFSNLATTASLSVEWDSNNLLSTAHFSRGGVNDLPIYRHTLLKTGVSETIAGESCAVWLARPITNEGVTYTACVTHDGILLRDTALYRNGTVMGERRAVKVERRRVAPEEVLPPIEALSWPRWVANTPPALPNDGNNNYELILAANVDGKPATKTLREAEGSRSDETFTGSGVRDILLFNAAVNFSYSNRGNPQLIISRKSTYLLIDPRNLISEPADKPQETILNQSCTWFNAAVNMADYSRWECRTHDGLPLIREEGDPGGGRVTWKATELRRGRMSRAFIHPPSTVIDWSYWGWPQLSKRS